MSTVRTSNGSRPLTGVLMSRLTAKVGGAAAAAPIAHATAASGRRNRSLRNPGPVTVMALLHAGGGVLYLTLIRHSGTGTGASTTAKLFRRERVTACRPLS